MKIEPLFDRVLILPTPEKTTLGGLSLPSGAEDRPLYGKVMAVGKGKTIEGEETKLEVKVGDKVIYGKYGGFNIVIDKTEYVIMRQTDILAKLEEN